MKIKLTQIEIKNFKGIADRVINFDGDVTTIKGKNGSGKTTVFDAFLWCMFGKNAEMKSAFNVATLDENGAIIPGLTHSVKVTIEKDINTSLAKETYTLERVQIDKKNGGSTCKYIVNGYDKAKKEFDELVSKELCTENNFKAITSPFFFTAQKWQSQRETLMSLIDESKLEIPAEFREKIANLKQNGITLTEHRAKLQKDLKTIQKEIDSENARLVVLKGQNREYATDFESIETLKAAKEKELAEIENGGTQIVELTKKKSQLEIALQVATNEAKQKANEAYYSQLNEQNALKQKFSQAQRSIIADDTKIKDLTAEVEELTAYRDQLRANHKEIFESQIQLSENDFKCPTCGREFEPGKISEIQAELTAKFNANRSALLKDIAGKGKKTNADIEEKQFLINEAQEDKARYMAVCKEINTNPLFTAELKPVAEVADTEQMHDLRQQIADVAEQLKKCELASEVERRKTELKQTIADFNQKLGLKTLIQKNEEQIAKSEAYIESENHEYAATEKEIADLAEVQNTINAEIEKQVNGLFKFTKFKLFETQVNGETVETCEATANGVPYSDLNTAARINVGLDIINVLSLNIAVFAPIFIDNAESVNEILETKSQQIRLMVSDDTELTIQ